MENTSELLKQITARKNEFRTDRYPMSIGEIVNLYKDKELQINPDFQRFFRWSIQQQTNFIESILLGIPVPSIFVYQNDKGVWELVDGLQRIGTILKFMGLLKDERIPEKLYEPTILSETELLPELKGKKWADFPINPLQLAFKRYSIGVEIIKYETDPNAKFEVFQRLNTGGTFLSDQEMRNCMLIMINKEFFVWLEKLSKDINFQECLSLSDKLIDERYEMELLLRFIIYPDYKYNQKGVGEFLTQSIKEIAKKASDGKFDYQDTEISFTKTFALLNEIMGENAFKKNGKGKFLESLFEVVSIGLSANVDDYKTNKDKEILKEKILNLWNEPEFVDNMGSGSNASVRIPRIVPFGVKYFKK